MSWMRRFLAAFGARRPDQRRARPTCRPCLEHLEKREVLSTNSPVFQLQSNGNLVQTNSGGQATVIDHNVKSFGTYAAPPNQVIVFDLHTDGSVMQLNVGGAWSALGSNVQSMTVFSDGAGHGIIEMLGRDGSVWQYNVPAHSWLNINKANAKWMQGVADASGNLQALYWLNSNGALWRMNSSGQTTLLMSNVANVQLFHGASGTTRIITLTSNGGLWLYTDPNQTWLNLGPTGLTSMQAAPNTAGDPIAIYYTTSNGNLFVLNANGKIQQVDSFVQSFSLSAQGAPQIVYDPIGTYWNSLGRPSWLGTSVTGRLPAPTGGGLVAAFSNGVIYYTPQTGAHYVTGIFQSKWVANGGAPGALGAPISDPQSGVDGNSQNVIQLFQNGAIYVKAGAAPIVLIGALNAQESSVFAQLTDPNIRNTTEAALLQDGSLDRSAMLRILNAADAAGPITSNELSSLQTILNSGTVFNMPVSVQVLGDKVVRGDPADAQYQAQPLGNLKVGSSAAQLTELIDKWFYGTDEPSVAGSGPYTYALAKGSLYGSTGLPQYQDVFQGETGDCYLLSALAALALHNPQSIKAIIVDNHDSLTPGDDTYTVSFWNPNANAWDSVTVDSKLPQDSSGRFAFANMGGQLNSTSNVLWVALIEKAYAQINESGWMDRPAANSYAAISSGWPFVAMLDLTGKQGTEASLTTAAGVLAQWNANSLVVFNTSQNAPDPNVVQSHSYVMVGYNASTGIFTLFNPWGVNGGLAGATFKPGILQYTWAQMVQNMDSWNYLHA
jgi:Calpain family cysteine protease/LGFP repeat